MACSRTSWATRMAGGLGRQSGQQLAIVGRVVLVRQAGAEVEVPISSPCVTSGTMSATPDARSAARADESSSRRSRPRRRGGLEIGEQRVRIGDVDGTRCRRLRRGRARRRHGDHGRRRLGGSAEEAAEGPSSRSCRGHPTGECPETVTEDGVIGRLPSIQSPRSWGAGRDPPSRSGRRRRLRGRPRPQSFGKRGRRELTVVAGAVEAAVDARCTRRRTGWKSAMPRAWMRRPPGSGPGLRRSGRCSPTTKPVKTWRPGRR